MSYEEKIRDQAQPHPEAGEHVLSAFIARPRGSTTAGAGGVVGSLVGGRKITRERRGAEDGGLQLAGTMALVLTEQRLIVLEVSPPLAFGKGGDVKGLVSAVPVGEVESVEIKRLLVGKVVELVVSGASFKLEAGAGADTVGFADALARLQAPV
jgi:hypothetical protein